MSQNNSGNQEMIRATQFSTAGPVGDPRTWAYPQHCAVLRYVTFKSAREIQLHLIMSLY